MSFITYCVTITLEKQIVKLYVVKRSEVATQRDTNKEAGGTVIVLANLILAKKSINDG